MKFNVCAQCAKPITGTAYGLIGADVQFCSEKHRLLWRLRRETDIEWYEKHVGEVTVLWGWPFITVVLMGPKQRVEKLRADNEQILNLVDAFIAGARITR